jgi:TM2 domain-containing membrane protein YozV/RNA polymerase subunit RPABC4/transcription elongation factor Spt4
MSESKYCFKCGLQIDQVAEICPKCGDKQPEITKMKYCSNCGSKIDLRAEICPDCGVRQLGSNNYLQQGSPYPQMMYQQKNPALAAFLSFIIVGLGQIYNGEFAKGILLLLILPTIGLVLFFMIYLTYFLFFIIPFIWFIAVYDAYATAKKINQRIMGYNISINEDL